MMKHGMTRMLSGLPVRLAIVPVLAYQAIARSFLIGSCRHYPTCSDYAVQALCAHGVLSGTVLTVKRLFRCHPFAAGGYDPVPPRSSVI